MTGVELKRHLEEQGFTPARIYTLLGMSSQAYNQAMKVADIKTGFLERICEVTGLKISCFYPEHYKDISPIQANNIANEGSAIVQNNNVRMSAKDNALYDMAMTMLDNAQKLIESTLNVQRDMRGEHQNSLELCDKIYKVQQEHIEKSREWLTNSANNIKNLRNDIQEMFNRQTAETKKMQDESSSKIISMCVTYNPDKKRV